MSSKINDKLFNIESIEQLRDVVSKNLRKFFINLFNHSRLTKKIQLKLIKSNELDLSNISRKTRKIFEELAKKKYPNDPTAMKKAILEAKDTWLTSERMNEFKEKIIHRKGSQSSTVSIQHHVNVEILQNSLSKDMEKIEKNIEKSSLIRWFYAHTLETNNLSDINEKKLKNIFRKRTGISIDLHYVGQNDVKNSSEDIDN